MPKNRMKGEKHIRECGDELFLALLKVSATPKDALNILAYVVAKYLVNVTTQGDKLLMELVVLVKGCIDGKDKRRKN